jgi:hypothetical protein
MARERLTLKSQAESQEREREEAANLAKEGIIR